MSQSVSSRWFALLKAAFVLSAISMVTLAFQSVSTLPDAPITEDAYYSLTVARNLADGKGLTIDGKAWTNGFQPLFTIAVCAPIYVVTGGDPIASIRGLYLVSCLVAVVTALGLGLLVYRFDPVVNVSRRRLRAYLAAMAYITAAQVWRFHCNGLETGWLMFMYVATWLYYQRFGADTVARAAGFGGMLGLVVLTRIDAGFLVVIAAFGAGLGGSGPLRARITRLVVVGVCAFVVSSPWWAYNFFGFGSLMPSSGVATARIGIEAYKVEPLVRAVSLVATPTFFLGRHDVPVIVALRGLAFVGFVVIIYRAVRSGAITSEAMRDAASRRTKHFAIFFALTYLILGFWYLNISGAYWFYLRYLAPAAILGSLVLGIAIAESRGRLQLLGLMAILGLSFQTPVFAYLHQRGGIFSGSPYYNDLLGLVREHAPPDAVIAAGQSGTLGYWRDNVLNCDGKVNHEALAYLGHLQDYLDANDVDWWVDAGLFPGADQDAWELVATRDQLGIEWTLYRRRQL